MIKMNKMELIAIFKPGVAVNVKSYLERLQQTDPIILHIWESVGQRQSCTVCQKHLEDIPYKDPACHILQLLSIRADHILCN